MFNLDVDINSIAKIDEMLKKANSVLKVTKTEKFNKFLKQKVLDLLEQEQKSLVGNEDSERVVIKDEHVDIYKDSHHIEDVSGGFILYNNAVVEAETSRPDNYDGGIFPLALAIEYGTGITAEVGSYSAGVFTPWDYNVHEYKEYWYLLDGRIADGHRPYEIYSNVALETEEKYNQWVEEYLMRKGVV